MSTLAVPILAVSVLGLIVWRLLKVASKTDDWITKNWRAPTPQPGAAPSREHPSRNGKGGVGESAVTSHAHMPGDLVRRPYNLDADLQAWAEITRAEISQLPETEEPRHA